MDTSESSRTAVIVGQGRAVAQGRFAPGRFDDPTALTLLRPDERVAVEMARTGRPPKGWNARIGYEMLRSSSEVMVPRTVAIDEAIRDHLALQLVILGAGLDGRAWRMVELRDVAVFEVDHPATQRDKVERAAGLSPVTESLRFVAVDFGRDSLDRALDDAGHDITVPTTWVWEGVVPYLTCDEVHATVRIIERRSRPGSRVIVNYQTPSRVAVAGRLVAQAMTMVSRQPDPWRREPRRSAWTPESMRALLSSYGFTVTADDDLLTIAGRLGMTPQNSRSVANGRVAVADRA